MSANLIKVNDGYIASNHCEFQVSQDADIANLPECAVGSIAYMYDLSAIWILGEDGEWHQTV